MTLPELITKHRLPCAYFAERLNIANGTFCNKMKGNRGAYFNEREQALLKSIIKEMSNDFALTMKDKNSVPHIGKAVRSERVDKGKKRSKYIFVKRKVKMKV